MNSKIINNKTGKALKRGVIYCRVATKSQVGLNINLEMQENFCKNYAKRNGIKVVKLFSDDCASGMTMDRKGLQEMFKFCGQKNNKIDYMIVHRVDRLTRNSMDYSSIWVMLSSYGVRIISATEDSDGTPIGQFIRNMQIANALLHNQMISERTKAGIAARKQRLALANKQSNA